MRELTFEEKIEAAKRHLEKAAKMCQKWHDSIPPGSLTIPKEREDDPPQKTAQVRVS